MEPGLRGVGAVCACSGRPPGQSGQRTPAGVRFSAARLPALRPCARSFTVSSPRPAIRTLAEETLRGGRAVGTSEPQSRAGVTSLGFLRWIKELGGSGCSGSGGGEPGVDRQTAPPGLQRGVWRPLPLPSNFNQLLK